MEIEYEVKILDVNVGLVEQRLIKAGAKKTMERKMRRYVYDIEAKNAHQWLRLRDDGERITLTFKDIKDESIEGTSEIEVAVNDFERAFELLRAIGFKHQAYQENRRISYTLDDVHVEIDFWPGIPAYVEIEGPSEAKVKSAAHALGFNDTQLTTKNTYDIYEAYGKDLRHITDLRFSGMK